MESKKRGGGKDSDDDELEEEVKMEEFYSLLRNFRDARDRRRKELQELEKNETNKKKMKTTMKPNPEASLEWQDFTTEIHFRKPPLIFPTPIPCDTDKKGEKKEQHQDRSLDLKLAL